MIYKSVLVLFIVFEYYKFAMFSETTELLFNGVLADNIDSFTSKFDTQYAIEEIITKENVE